jgi:hypothetical protein
VGLFSKLKKLSVGAKLHKKTSSLASKLPGGKLANKADLGGKLIGTNSSASKTDVTATSSTSGSLKKKADVDAMLSDGIKGNHAAYMRDNGGKYADDTPAATTPAPSIAVGEPNPGTPRKQAFNREGVKLDQMSTRVSRRGPGTPGSTMNPIPMPKNSSPVTGPVTSNAPSAGKPGSIDQVNPGRGGSKGGNRPIVTTPEIGGTTAGGTGRMSVYNNMNLKPRRSMK